MTEWREVELRELCDAVEYGVTTSAVKDGHTGPRLLRITDIVPPRIDWLNVPHCDLTATQASKYQLKTGDIVVARTGATVGYAKYLNEPPRSVFASYLVRFQISEAADARYVGYVVESEAYKEYVKRHAGGAAQPNANAKTLGSFRVPLPRLDTQRRIAAMLSAVDELIDINDRRIELLENLARSLYREWFVRYRFSGHESVELVDSEVGPIPESWEVKPCGEVLSMLGGGTPSKKEPGFWEDGVIPWFTPSDLTKASTRFAAEPECRITPAGLAKSSARLFPAGSVLMTSRATLGVLAIATQDASCNQGFIVFPPDARFPPSYIYEWLTAQAQDLEMIATGATFKEITKGALKRFPMLVPTPGVLLRFDEVAAPIGAEVEALESKNRRLAATRDLLLPRLVTGRLDISNVDLGDLLLSETA